MKKTIAVLLSLVLLWGCASNEKAPTQTSSATYENSVELTTSEFTTDDYAFFEDGVDIAITKISFDDALRMFDENGTGIIVWGYTNCPYCQRALPVLNDAALSQDVPVYYVDIYAEEISDEQFNALIEKLEAILTTVDGEPTMYVPEVVAIKDGKIVGNHLSLVDSFDGSKQNEMTEDQKTELQNIYIDLIKKLY